MYAPSEGSRTALGLPDDGDAAVVPVGSSRFVRWLAPAVVVFGTCLVLVPMGSILAWGAAADIVIATIATVVVAPIYAWLLSAGVRAIHSPRVVVACVLLASTVVATTLLFTNDFARLLWLPQFSALAVGAVLALRGWARAAFGPIFVLVPASVLVVTGGSIEGAVILTMQVSWRVAAVLVMVWLAASLRILESTREELVDQTRAAERARMNIDLQRTLGAVLSDLHRRGEILSSCEGPELAAGLRELVTESRLGLANARRIIRSLPERDMTYELHNAAALLDAAGIPTTVLWDQDEILAADAPLIGSTLHLAVQELLARRPAPVSCTITLDHHNTAPNLVTITTEPPAGSPGSQT